MKAKKPKAHNGKIIAAAKKKTGTATDWKNVFKKLDKKK